MCTGTKVNRDLAWGFPMILANPKMQMATSLSAYLLEQTCQLRNPSGEDENCLWTLSKRVVGELCFAGLLVVALVETVVRALMVLPAFLINLCIDEQYVRLCIRTVTLFGMERSFVAAFGCLSGLVQNVYKNTLFSDELARATNEQVDADITKIRTDHTDEIHALQQAFESIEGNFRLAIPDEQIPFIAEYLGRQGVLIPNAVSSCLTPFKLIPETI